MRYYEAIYIVHPNLEDAGLTKVVETTKKALSKRGGELLYEEIMGKKRLAYAVEKQRFGTYVLLQFQGDGVDNSRFSQDLELNDDVIAQMIVTIDEDEIRTASPEAEATEGAAKSEAKAEVKAEVKSDAEPVADKAPEEPEKETAEEEVSPEPAAEEEAEHAAEEEAEPAAEEVAEHAAAEESPADEQEVEETGTDEVTEVDAEADSPV